LYDQWNEWNQHNHVSAVTASKYITALTPEDPTSYNIKPIQLPRILYKMGYKIRHRKQRRLASYLNAEGIKVEPCYGFQNLRAKTA
jgi:hypothetical protein